MELAAFEYRVVDGFKSRNRATNDDDKDLAAFRKELLVDFSCDGYHGMSSSPYIVQT